MECRREWDGSGGEMTNDGGRPHARHLSDLATVNDLDLHGGGPAASPDLLDGLDHVHALHNLAEHDMLAVEPWGRHGADEELGAVAVGPAVGHGQHPGSRVLAHQALVGEQLAVDGLPAGPAAPDEVAALAHELRDHAVEPGALVVQRLAGFPIPRPFSPVHSARKFSAVSGTSFA